jgi:hypothetical protein
MQKTIKEYNNERSYTVVEQDSGFALRIARTTLGYLAMDDELMKRMELAFGEIRILGGGSDTIKISIKNKRQIEEFETAFNALKNSKALPRDLEILAEILVDICVDIICESKRRGQMHC